jgi:hypothetical protein
MWYGGISDRILPTIGITVAQSNFMYSELYQNRIIVFSDVQ